MWVVWAFAVFVWSYFGGSEKVAKGQMLLDIHFELRKMDVKDGSRILWEAGVLIHMSSVAVSSAPA